MISIRLYWSAIPAELRVPIKDDGAERSVALDLVLSLAPAPLVAVGSTESFIRYWRNFSVYWRNPASAMEARGSWRDQEFSIADHPERWSAEAELARVVLSPEERARSKLKPDDFVFAPKVLRAWAEELKTKTERVRDALRSSGFRVEPFFFRHHPIFVIAYGRPLKADNAEYRLGL